MRRVEHLGEVLEPQLAAHVVHEVGERRACEWAQRLVRRADRRVVGADEHL